MISFSAPASIAGGYFVAAAFFFLGFYFQDRTMLCTGFYLFAGLVILKVTFAWGRVRGFAGKGDDGRIVFSHVLRALVMAALVSAALWVLTALLIVLVF